MANARRGFRVFPCRAGQKTPAVKAFYDWATTDEDKLIAWWTAHPNDNPAISTDDLVVVDIDVKSDKAGLASYKALDLPPSYTVGTPSGGFHVYFKGECRNSAERVAPGLDVRGHHGYVLASGARTDAGAYVARADRDVIAAPAALSGLLPVPERSANGTAAPTVAVDPDTSIPRAISWLREGAPVAVEGSAGDDATFRVAARLKDMGVSEFDAWAIMDEHWNPRCSPPWEPEDLEAKVRNAYAYGTRPAGVDAPEVIFQDVVAPMPERPGLRWGWHGDPAKLEGQWLFYNMLPAHGTLLVVGATQAGKTFLLAELARCIATGKSFFGIPPDEKGGVICLFAGTEGSGIENRLAALGEAGRLPIAFAHIPNLRQTGALEALTKDVKDQASFMESHFGVPVRLVILETVSASGLVDKENEAADVAAAIRAVGIIGREVGCLFATSHHPAKNGANPRGSGAWTANVDCEIQIGRDGSSQVRIVELTKSRNASQRTLGSFTLEEVELGIDERGRGVKSMRVTMSADMSAIKKARKSQFVETMEQSLDQIATEDWVEIGDRKGVEKKHLRKIFAELKPGDKNPSNTTKAYHNALSYLEQSGVIDMVGHAGGTYIVRRTYE